MQHRIRFLRLGMPLSLVNTRSLLLFCFFSVGIMRPFRIRLKNILWQVNLCKHSCAWLYHYVKGGKVVCVYIKCNKGTNSWKECQRGKNSWNYSEDLLEVWIFWNKTYNMPIYNQENHSSLRCNVDSELAFN